MHLHHHRVVLALALALMLTSCSEESTIDNEVAPDQPDQELEDPLNFDQFRVISGPPVSDDYCVPDCDITIDTCTITPYFGTMAIVEVLAVSDLIKLGGDEPYTVDHVCNPEDYGWRHNRTRYQEVQLRIVEHVVGDKFAPSETKLMKILGIPDEDSPASGYRLLSFYEIEEEFFVSNWGYAVEPSQGMVSDARQDIAFPTDLSILRTEMREIRQEAPGECPNGVSRITAERSEELAREIWFGAPPLAGLCEQATQGDDEPDLGE